MSDPRELDAQGPLRGEEIAGEVISAAAEPEVPVTGMATARKALNQLTAMPGFFKPTPVIRKHVAMAFAGKGKVVYGQAFDVVRIKDEVKVDLENLESVEANLTHIILYELKATNRAKTGPSFAGHFFSLSTAELLVAQSLGNQFRFAFVNVSSDAQPLILTLQELLGRIRAIYPSWSLRI